jgi:hypothetical protein
LGVEKLAEERIGCPDDKILALSLVVLEIGVEDCDVGTVLTAINDRIDETDCPEDSLTDLKRVGAQNEDVLIE